MYSLESGDGVEACCCVRTITSGDVCEFDCGGIAGELAALCEKGIPQLSPNMGSCSTFVCCCNRTLVGVHDEWCSERTVGVCCCGCIEVACCRDERSVGQLARGALSSRCVVEPRSVVVLGADGDLGMSSPSKKQLSISMCEFASIKSSTLRIAPRVPVGAAWSFVVLVSSPAHKYNRVCGVRVTASTHRLSTSAHAPGSTPPTNTRLRFGIRGPLGVAAFCRRISLS